MNRQGGNISSQYRSTILCHTPTKQVVAKTKNAQLHAQKYLEQRIVTVVKAAINFYSAKDYHQDYVTNNRENKYCQLVVAKKFKIF
ncbi:MAG: peptide-methionine (S)-S-oxide reductase [Cognaticolwellia sp.]